MRSHLRINYRCRVSRRSPYRASPIQADKFLNPDTGFLNLHQNASAATEQGGGGTAAPVSPPGARDCYALHLPDLVGQQHVQRARLALPSDTLVATTHKKSMFHMRSD